MNLKDENFTLLVDTFNEVISHIEASTSAEEKMYYFSATFGNVNRIMNFDCDPVLVFMHQVLQVVHQNLTVRMNQPINPNNASIMGTPLEFIDKLYNYTINLKDAIITKNDDLIRNELQKFANLSYATSGNGYYLFLTNRLHI